MKTIVSFLMFAFLLAACGYKGDLYLPKENDKAQFGVIQTGIDFKKPNATKSVPENKQEEQKWQKCVNK